MKRCYIVTKESKLYKNYDKWINSENEINELFKEFTKTQGIKATIYAYWHDKLYIVPTKEDLEKFENVLCSPIISNGLRSFKKNSKITKLWDKAIEEKNIKLVSKPNVVNYFNTSSYRMNTQLFKYNNILYCSFAIEENFKEVPEGFIEIKESEFCKVVEEIRSNRGED